MIQVTPQMRILVAVEPVDFRKGIDGLAKVCREELQMDPFRGSVFVFRNKRGTSLKVLVYDGQGFWLCQKRLSSGRFQGWPEGSPEAMRRLEVPQLQLLLWNGDPRAVQAAPFWKRIKAFPDDHIKTNRY
jgi:transposase